MTRLFVALLALCVALPIEAATYRYIGATFTDTFYSYRGEPENGLGYIPGVDGRAGEVTATRLRATLTFSSPLSEGTYTIDDGADPVSWSISAAPFDLGATYEYWGPFDYKLVIDAKGRVVSGSFGFSRGAADYLWIRATDAGSFVEFGQEYNMEICDLEGCEGSERGYARAYEPGVWTVAPVPLPASGLLLLTPLALLAFRRRRA